MSERPIIFSGPMVTAILGGRKTQTRRIVKQFPTWGHVQELSDGSWEHSEGGFDHHVRSARCPYGRPGDRLWVREVAAWDPKFREPGDVWYRADPKWDEPGSGYYPDNKNWRSPIHMPKWASRITLEVMSVRVERLQAITEEDARAEGITDGGCLNCGEPEPCVCAFPTPDARDAFIGLWDSINAKRGHAWDTNPWVWVIEFRQVTP